MTVTRQGGSATMTAVNEALTGVFFLTGINFQGTSLTAGHRLRILDTGGSVIADYIVEGTSDNADLLAGREGRHVDGVRIENNTVGGTWVVTFIFG